jgi:hypothetical protein
MIRNLPVAGSSRWPVRLALLVAVASGPLLLADEPRPQQPKAEAPKAEAPKAEKKERKGKRAPRPAGEGPHERMDYGRFLAATIKAPGPGPDNNALKGVAIKLGPENDPRKATVCFDTDLLRYSAGWLGGFLQLRGTPFDGGHGSWPEVAGTQVFGTKVGPGWAKAGNFRDPRPEPFGPLPADWAKYQGMYRSGESVVLAYTVGDCRVLESPGILGETDDATAFTRTFNLSASSQPLTLVVAESDSPRTEVADRTFPATELAVAFETGAPGKLFAAVVGAPEGSTWTLTSGGSKLLLGLPKLDRPARFRLAVAGGPGSLEPAKAEALVRSGGAPGDLAPLTRGGPSRWPQTVETRGTLGTGDGAYVVDTITAPDENPYRSWIRFGGVDFFSDGRAALSTWSGDVWVVSGIDDKLEKLTWRRFATGLYQPLGLKVVGDVVHTLGRDGITRLVDTDGDGEADWYEAFNHDMAVTTGFHEFAFDLQTDADGNFYFAKAGPVKSGGRGFDTIAANSGTIMKVYKDGKTLINYATGLRAPNGIGVGPDGQVTSGDNEGTWMPKCRLNWIKPGGFYGVVDLAHRDEKPTMYDEPICWFPKDVDNSSGGQAWVTSDRWGPFSGRLLHTSYGTCSLYLALVDQAGEHIQGGVTRFPVNFLSGIMRPRFNPRDGQLYIAGLRGWQSSAARDACFQRVRYTGKPANMPTGLKVTKTGIDISFTDPLDPEDATDPDSYDLEQWNYLWTGEYGSEDYSSKTPDFEAKVRELNRLREDPSKNGEAIDKLVKQLAKGRDPIKVESAALSPDGKTVTLTIADLRPVMQMRIRGKLKAVDGAKVPLEIYNTINFVP